MSKAIFTIFIFTFLLACTSADNKIPKDIIGVDSMKIIVWHLIQAGDYASVLKSKDSTIKSINTSYFAGVLKLHHLDKNTFLKNFNFYQAHPNFNSILFDSVNAYAQRQRTDMYRIRQ